MVKRDVMFKEDIFPFLLKQHEDNNPKIVMNELPLVQGEARVQMQKITKHNDVDEVTDDEILNQESTETVAKGVDGGETSTVRRTTREKHIPKKLRDFEYVLPQHTQVVNLDVFSSCASHEIDKKRLLFC